MINFETFKKLVPAETLDFVTTALPYLDYYMNNERELNLRKSDSKSLSYYSKFFFLMIYALTDNPEYKTFFSKYGFERDRIKIDEKCFKSPSTNKEKFTRLVSIIPEFDDMTKYETLFPIDIIIPFLDSYYSKCQDSIFEILFSRDSNISNLKSDLIKYNESIKTIQEQKLEEELYGDLPINVISYLETASKIRTLLLSNNLQNLDSDIVPLSLIIAIYFYKDIPNQKEENIREQDAIKELLNSKGISLDKICQNINGNINSRNIADTKRNLIAIKNLYKRYCIDGFYQDKEESLVTVSGIIQNALSRDFTNSVIIEKLFAKMNCYIGSFENFDELVNKYIEVLKRKYSTEYVKNFYNDLSKKNRDFADFTAKIYILILEKMKAKEHNEKLLFCEDDADSLALLIASYYYKCDVSEFFKDYGITLDKIMKLLNLSISREEINRVELDQKILVDRYKRFFFEGVNKNKRSENININDIARNLCDREFNRSIIIESIFSELTNEIDLQSNFLNQLEEHLKNKENNRKINLSQKLFYDMPVETIELLESTSRIHQYLASKLSNVSKEDIKSYSLLLSILMSNSDAKDFFIYHGFELNKVCTYLGISSSSLISDPVNVDLLKNEYGEYIFSGENKNIKREDLTCMQIAKNIFSKKLNNSVNLSKFLSFFNLNYDYYANFDEKFLEYKKATKEKQERIEAEELIKSYYYSKSYLINVFRIHEMLKIRVENKSINQSLVSDEEDIKELSMILSLFLVDNSSKNFFEKNNITKEYILSICGLPSDFLELINETKIDYVYFSRIYSAYFKEDNEGYRERRKVDDFAKRIFDIGMNDSMLLEGIAAKVGANYDILKEEVETGRDYELSLTVEDRVALLSEENVDPLDLDDVKSVLHFGNSLSVHSKYINEEYPKLMLSDVHQTSINTINSIMSRVYEKQIIMPTKKGLFSRLFSKPKEEQTKYVFNQDAIQELKEAIETNIENLSKELLGYEAIKRYIEVYRRKNRSHFLVSNQVITKLKEELSHLDINNEEDYDRFLTVSSRLQTMSDKANRFATTNHVMKQELFKLNQAVANHFITINALEMARDDFIPLVGTEIAIGQGRVTENQSLELSQNIMNLFKSMLDRNVDSAVENMERLRSCNLPNDIFASLNRDIETYLQGLNQVKTIETRIEDLDIDQVNNELVNLKEFNYEVTPDLPVKKVLK